MIATLPALLLAASLASLGLQDEAPGYGPARLDHGTLDERLHGVWRSRGYGWLAHVTADDFVLYDHGPAGTRRVSETKEDLLTWFGYFERTGDVVVVGGKDPANSTTYTFDRLEALPESVATAIPSDPESVFEYFWRVMDAHYSFFDLWGVDWQARYEEYRPRVTAATTDAELFRVLRDALAGMQDDHLLLEAELDGVREIYSPGFARVLIPTLREAFRAQDEIASFDRFVSRWRGRYKNSVATVLLDGDYQLEADGRVLWGRLGTIGYVNLLAMGGFAPSDDMEVEVPAVHAAMGRILAGLADCEAIIVDVTQNTGGYDEVQLAIAAHFAREKTLAFTKFPAGIEGVEPQPFYVLPAEEHRFLGPVALVTSDYTVSAGEDFTLAMRALPNVTHYGMATCGSFSDVLPKELPNGWTVNLSHEVYLDGEGRHWEGKGVPPEVPLAVFDPADIENSHVDAIFEVADALLQAGG